MNKKSLKRVAITTLALNLLVSLTVTGSTSAQSGCHPDDAADQALNGYYTFIESGSQYIVETTDKGKAEKFNLCVPAEHNGKTVNEIAWMGFAETQAEELYFVDSSVITKISGHAFENAQAYNPIELPSLREIPIKSFNGAQFREIKLDSSKVTHIGTAAFAKTVAKHPISLPLLTSIPLDAFSASRFTEIHVDKDKVTSIDTGSFSGTRATNVMELPLITTIPSDAFSGSFFSELLFTGENITSIGFSAFDSALATNPVRFPNITEVEYNTFMYSNFPSIELDPNKITAIGRSAFEGVKASNNMYLPNITHVPVNAFTWAEFNNITFDKDKVTSLGENAFMGVTATNVMELPNVTEIPDRAFQYAAFPDIIIDKDKITYLGSEAFTYSEASQNVLIEVNGKNLSPHIPSDYKYEVFNKIYITREDTVTYIDRVGLFTSDKMVLVHGGDLAASAITPAMIDSGIDISGKYLIRAGVDYAVNTEYTLVTIPWHDEPYTVVDVYDLISLEDNTVPPTPGGGGDTGVDVKPGPLELQLKGSSSLFLNVELTGTTKEVGVPYESNLLVSDARGTQESWTLSVRSSPLTNAGGHELSAGILKLEGINVINLTTSKDTTTVRDDSSSQIILDDGSTTRIYSNTGGLYQHGFNRLVMSVDPSKIRISRDDSTYKSVITWTLTTGP